MKLAFITDPIAKLNPGHDTSVALMEAAQQRGHQIYITQAECLSAIDGQAYAPLQPVKLKVLEAREGRWIVDQLWYEVSQAQLTPLGKMDAVFMRTDPPVTIPYLYATYILDLIPNPTLVINSPRGIRAANEKMYALQFSSVIPKTIVTAEKQIIQDFLDSAGAAVIKPLGGKAGEGILFLQDGDRNFNSLVEISTKQGAEPVMVQSYLPEATQGDKRIILLDGEPIGAVNRIPTGNEFRGNMAVGGRAERVQITARDREICAAVAPQLRSDGLYFVGLDVIGGYLTEVNVTSPTGIREIDLLESTHLGDRVITWLEQRTAN